MIEPIEKRLLLHSANVNNGVLFLAGVDGEDDVLTVTVVGNSFRAQAVNDGFSQDFPISQVTAGINISGGTGNDQITIQGDITLPTTLAGGGGADTVNGGAGKDNITGDDDADMLLGNGNRDLISGGGGADTLSGGSKNDTLTGGSGGDLFVGSAGGLDRVDFSEKVVRVDVSLDGVANDGASGEGDNIAETCEVFAGGAGGDFIRGSGKPNLLIGNDGNDTLIGGSGDDSLFAGSGEDSLDGQSGSDFLESVDQERDVLFGGSGSDSADSDGNDVLDGIP